jgi:hypothetical protein
MIAPPFLTLFVTAMELTGRQRLMLMWPLCLAVALVYKTTRCNHLRAVPRETAVLWVTIVLAMYVVGAGLWALFESVG